jgi:hypothetical protein
VGTSTKPQPNFDDEFGQSTTGVADASGPLEVRIMDKNWSVRAQAFEELA